MTDLEAGLPLMNIGGVIRSLSAAYVQLIRSGTALAVFPSVMLWGPPGVGKSQGVRQIAEIIENETGKTVHLTDVRLMLFNPVDLRGIPTANADRSLAVWLRPKIFEMDAGAGVINILFLDEISSAPQSVQAAAYQITQDRAIGEHRLPDNCIILAAGNRVTDRSVVYNMPRALANRLLHLEVKGDPDAWHDWAVRHGIHRFVTSYLAYNPTALLRTDAPDGSLAFPTPRSWEMVSNILTHITEDVSAAEPLLSGCVGSHVIALFCRWCSLFAALPSCEAIFAGKPVTVDKSAEMQEVLVSEMVFYAAAHPDGDLLANSVNFSLKMPWNFRMKLLHDYNLLPQVAALLQGNAVYQEAVKAGLK